MLLWLSLVFYLTIQQSFGNPIFWQSKFFDNPNFFCPKSDSFSSHFSPSRESFSRQTQRQKLLLFTQRAIVVELAINPLKNSEKKLKTWKFVLLLPVPASPCSNLTLSEKKKISPIDIVKPPQFRWHCHTIFRDWLMSQQGGRFRLLPLEI